MLTPEQRVEAALRGDKPDRVPIVPIYDFGYVMKCIGRDAREYVTSFAVERIRFVEESFLRHEVDGCLVHSGTNDDWTNSHTIEKRIDYCTFNRKGLSSELARQIRGAGSEGAFVVGTPIMPPNAQPEAVDFYFAEARRMGVY